MGIIDGAIIGGVIGAVVAGYTAWQMTQWQKKFLAAVDAGDQAGARRIVARSAAAVKKARSFPLNKILPQRHRLIALWLLGDLEEVRRELEIHAGTGSAAYLTSVHLWGLLAQAVDAAAAGGDVTALVQEIQATAARVEKESNALQKLLRDYANMIAKVAAGLAGQPADDAVAKKLLEKAHGESILSRILLLRTLQLAAERAGKPTSVLVHNLRQLTKRFAPSAQA